MQVLGDRQQTILWQLLREDGLTIEQLVTRLAITRTAVRQHLGALERDGYVRKQGLRLSGGRPGYVYSLSPTGNELFPRQYSWFSVLMLEQLRERLGSGGLVSFLRELAGHVAAGLAPRLQGKSPEAQVQEVTRIMNELGYDAKGLVPRDTAHAIVANNCVYHHLAQAIPEICEFDLGLIESLTGARAGHPECIVRGGQVCHFLLDHTGVVEGGKRSE
jgi:DeoR family transcriptional regulator, suf operon transcriptional repressor